MKAGYSGTGIRSLESLYGHSKDLINTNQIQIEQTPVAHTASIKFQCWEKDYSTDDDNLGSNSIQFVYDYTSDTWTVTSDNKSVTVDNSGLNGRKKGEMTIDDSDGKVKLVYYVSWE